METSTWIGLIAVIVITLFGGGGLAVILIQRFFQKGDDRQIVTDTNFVRKVDADEAATRLMYERLKEVEAEVKILRNENTELKIGQGDLKADLKIRQDSLDKEIAAYGQINDVLSDEREKNSALELHVKTLQTSLNDAHKEINSLSREIINSQKTTIESVIGELSKMLADLKKATKAKPGSNYMVERRAKY